MSELSDAALKWLIDHLDYEGEKCLIWPFSINRFWGRGQLTLDGKTRWAHRHMCRLVHGEPPSDKPYAAHECGNGHLACVHPKHLFWKTSSENAFDRRAHGRPEGAKGRSTRLTTEQVAEIQACKGTVTQFDLAKKFNISRGSIEYWQKQGRPPVTHSDDPRAIYFREWRRRKKAGEPIRAYRKNEPL